MSDRNRQLAETPVCGAAGTLDLDGVYQAVRSILEELWEKQREALWQGQKRGPAAPQVWVIGASTSEVQGHPIGKQGSEAIAARIFRAAEEVARERDIRMAYQCCEHLNRALVVDRSTAMAHSWEPVTVVPVPEAGGALAAYAFAHMEDPVVVEAIRADAGIDIGDTLIGMHLKPVAVPFRPSCRQVGRAHVTAAWTRPKLIGGSRAVYSRN